jgi:hypothetical protein
MAVPHVTGAFGDLLDPRFQKIFDDNFPQLNDMLPELYFFEPNNGRIDMRFSQVSGYGDIPQFSGSVTYQSAAQGYDTVITPLEFASGIQVQRRLFDTDQFSIMDQRPAGLARAAQRTRQGHGARPFNNAFSVDTFFYNNSEGVALCSDSHTTTVQSASTASGFDNLVTTALSATAVATARIQMRGFRDAAANRGDVEPDEILFPPDLYEVAFEINSSMGKVDTANNNRNVHFGRYTMKEWNYLADTNNWFLMDSSLRPLSLKWFESVPVEFAFAEDMDTIIAKWRLYGVWGNGQLDWPWILGANVS